MSANANGAALVTLFGGSGFIGRHLARTLSDRNYRVRIAVRRPYLVGRQPTWSRQIEAVRADVRIARTVEAAVRGAAVVINLAGILFERGEQRFNAVHAQGAGSIARAAARAGARLVHVSALGADADSRAAYARSKAQGEALVFAEAPEATVLRPSIVFGPEDEFINRFAAMARISPVLPLIGGGETRFQPVFVGDVAEAVVRAASGDAKPGMTYELGGPDVKTFRELMEFVLAETEKHRLLLPIPFAVAEVQASILQFLPTPPLTPGQVEMLKQDNVVSAAARLERRTLEALGIQPASLAAVAPTYLHRFHS